MRLLLDESIPRRLARHLTGVDVDTVYDRNWSALKNGELLRTAESDYDVFVTADQNLQYQQNLKGFKIRVAVLAAERTGSKTCCSWLPSSYGSVVHWLPAKFG